MECKNVVWLGKCIYSQSGTPCFKIYWGSIKPLMVLLACVFHILRSGANCSKVGQRYSTDKGDRLVSLS